MGEEVRGSTCFVISMKYNQEERHPFRMRFWDLIQVVMLWIMVHVTALKKSVKSQTKLLTFIDLAGHKKYFQTTITGLTSHLPNYIMLVVGPGSVKKTKECLGIITALELPFFIVISKADSVSPKALQAIVDALSSLLTSVGIKKIPFFVKSQDDYITAASNMSAVEISIKERMVGGHVYRGLITEDMILKVGPFQDGSFAPVKVTSIKRSHAGCRLLTTERNGPIRSKKLRLNHVNTFRQKCICYRIPWSYTKDSGGTVHIDNVRQTAIVVGLQNNNNANDDCILALWRFMRNPEFIQVGSRILFVEGSMKVIGFNYFANL
ncbi:unnamed protein product [Lepeophtheirus salmonis]|uniref:(salmon louse) hypothetical protein n=1 Tax=Lepeophtheirus salmonis TaxID=72036 RepID=A0A7R8H458_LEPSM|nr:unnamed protein product [Lepeophtheirus salmonis]CAF2853436.1 unnamed protein product [Lepeophtheirus salmonis]